MTARSLESNPFFFACTHVKDMLSYFQRPTKTASLIWGAGNGETEMVSVEISAIELLALKKLAVINGALAKSISGTASVEQMALTRVLIDVVNRAEVANATTTYRA